jgi:hypothetical protein
MSLLLVSAEVGHGTHAPDPCIGEIFEEYSCPRLNLPRFLLAHAKNRYTVASLNAGAIVAACVHYLLVLEGPIHEGNRVLATNCNYCTMNHTKNLFSNEKFSGAIRSEVQYLGPLWCTEQFLPSPPEPT